MIRVHRSERARSRRRLHATAIPKPVIIMERVTPMEEPHPVEPPKRRADEHPTADEQATLIAGRLERMERTLDEILRASGSVVRSSADEPRVPPTSPAGDLSNRLDRIESTLVRIMHERPETAAEDQRATREAFSEWVRLRRWREMPFADFLKLRRAGRI